MSTAEQFEPKVTIAIPTVDRLAYLQLALASALAQTYSNVEVVVSDNACTDGTAAYLASIADPRLHVVTQTERLPMVANWNQCLRAATGKYFLLLSDDDLMEPDAIRELVAGYAQQPEPGIVYCGGSFINSDGQITCLFRHSPLRESAHELIRANFTGQRDAWICSILFRTEDLQPGFPESFHFSCDSAAWTRAVLRRGDAVFVPQQLVRYRQHRSLSSTTPLALWLDDQTELRRWILAEEKRAHGPHTAFAKEMEQIMDKWDLRTIIAWINHSQSEHRLAALGSYARMLPRFFSLSGPYFLARGIFTLFLNEDARLWLRKRLRKQPVVAEAAHRAS